MGYAIFAAKSNVVLQRHIRAVAVDSALVFLTGHVKKRMRERGVGINEIYDILRHGTIVRPPEINIAKDSLECRMERYVGGRDRAVVVALDDDDPNLIVVTVWN